MDLHEPGTPVAPCEERGPVAHPQCLPEQTPEGLADAGRGIRQLVVGTGGMNAYDFGPALPNSEVREAGTFGLMKLTLEDGAYTWEFLPVEGGVLDQGRGSCH